MPAKFKSADGQQICWRSTYNTVEMPYEDDELLLSNRQVAFEQTPECPLISILVLYQNIASLFPLAQARGSVANIKVFFDMAQWMVEVRSTRLRVGRIAVQVLNGPLQDVRDCLGAQP